eukprot:TRINITY_DN3115_c0_g1_i2.p1 TRINITY_DN3115_c0_g1~~TRINITY_DN3115_c0_g1_i2.p1  ORF type:complete len:105 (-),score=16.16 TRINITY_DN3115_c0_g1_i2:351-665(-)
MSEAQVVVKDKERPTLNCTKHFDAIYFCYSPVYQMTQYYRDGVFDDCKGKWGQLWDCMSIKTKPAAQVQAYLEEKKRATHDIWTFRTREEAEKAWNSKFGHLQK